MDRDKLYEKITERKANPGHLLPYNGGNGRIDKFLDLVRVGDIPRGGSVLDVGGSHGDLVELALREGLFDDGYVLDISEESVKTAKRRGLKAYVSDVDKEGLQGHPGEFNCIVALDFIEHIVDPGNFARECHRSLRSGGYVFINTPNISYWRHLESLVVHGVFPHTSGDEEVYHGGHLAFYNELDLERIFSTFTDFRVYPDTSWDPPPPIWYNLSKVARDRQARMLSCPNLLFSCRKS